MKDCEVLYSKGTIQETIIRSQYNLHTIKTKKFVLISTSEVYGSKKTCLETTKNLKSKNTDYGLNRLMLENFVEKKFKDTFILRLPIVYGKKFVKNCIYDLKISLSVNSLLFSKKKL